MEIYQYFEYTIDDTNFYSDPNYCVTSFLR